MGNFYTNIVLRTSDVDAVAAAVAELDRSAFVAADGTTVIVFDEACDEQDLEELERLAVALSERLRCAALAVCNHDDDVLWYALAEAGKTIDIYDSNPGYFEGESDTSPSGGNARLLSSAFGVPEERDALESLLQQPHEHFGVEVERHESLRRHLGLPEGLPLLGYRYVSQGELPDDPAVTLRAIGSTELRRTNPQATQSQSPASILDERTRTALQGEGQDFFWNNYALVLAEADVPERFVPLVGIRHGNGHVLFTAIARYIQSQQLAMGGGWVRADDLLAEFLGEREFVIPALARLVRVALHIPPLSPEEIAAFQRGDVAIIQKAAEAFRAATGDGER